MSQWRRLGMDHEWQLHSMLYTGMVKKVGVGMAGRHGALHRQAGVLSGGKVCVKAGR